MLRLGSLVVLFAVLAAGCSGPQSLADTTAADAAESDTSAMQPDTTFKAFDDVIPKGTEGRDGLLTTYQVKEDLFFQVPDSLLEAELLLVSRVAQAPPTLGPFVFAGRKLGEQVVTWERAGRRLLLRRQVYATTAADSLAIAQSVRVNAFAPILAAFEIQARTPGNDASVIKVTDLFTSDVPALNGLSPSLRQQYGVRRLDGSRSLIDTVKVFPENVNVRHTLTFEATELASEASSGSLSMQLYQSMIGLPEEPMEPRRADDRVGYFTIERIDYGSEAQKAEEVAYIRRWRLVPKDPAAYARGELVEPETPITYVLDPATPKRWRPYFCRGVEDWNVAFEAAGFHNAVRCLQPEEAPDDFDPEDVRYSTVRYVASTVRNAMGPSVSDPRTGEILESDIVWWHNHIRSYRNRLMIETGAANPQARSLTIDDELIGETMRQVIAHEIGHAIGLPHNMIASNAFPVDSLRSPSFTAQYGVAPSIMEYARQNYIAQPGDGVERFVRMIGPYDLYAVEWGYRRFPKLDAQADKEARLDAMIRARADDPVYRYENRTGIDPQVQTEDLGDDPVKAGGYAVANLQRVVPNLIDWTSTPGENYDELEEIYGELVGMWSRYMNHVVTVVGGVEGTRKASDQPGVLYEPVPRDRQEAAVAFLTEQVFETPEWLLNRDVLRRIQPASAVENIHGVQSRLLGRLLDADRLNRLVEAGAFSSMTGTSGTAYPLPAFLSDLEQGIWREVEAQRPVTTATRRNLQRAYVEELGALAMPGEDERQTHRADLEAIARARLAALAQQVRQAARRTRDEATRAHLEATAARIDQILTPQG